MLTAVHLSDVDVEFFLERDRRRENSYGSELITKAYKALCFRDLRYVIATGIARDNNGELSRFTRREDIPTDYYFAEVAEYALQPFVRNAASRVARGFDA